MSERNTKEILACCTFREIIATSVWAGFGEQNTSVDAPMLIISAFLYLEDIAVRWEFFKEDSVDLGMGEWMAQKQYVHTVSTQNDGESSEKSLQVCERKIWYKSLRGGSHTQRLMEVGECNYIRNLCYFHKGMKRPMKCWQESTVIPL